MKRHIVGLVCAGWSLSVFVIISCFGWMVKYVEFPCYLRSVEADAQMYYLSSLFRRCWNKV